MSPAATLCRGAPPGTATPVLAPGQAGGQSAGRDFARHGADVRHRRAAPHPDAVLHRARRQGRPHLGVLCHRTHRGVLPDDVHPRVRRDGAGGPGRHQGGGRRRQHGRAAAGRAAGRHGRSSASSRRWPSPRFWRWSPGSRSRGPRRCRTISGSAWRRGRARGCAGAAAGRAGGDRGARARGGGARHHLQGSERGVHGGRWRSRSRPAATSRRWCCSIFWRRLHHRRRRDHHAGRDRWRRCC